MKVDMMIKSATVNMPTQRVSSNEFKYRLGKVSMCGHSPPAHPPDAGYRPAVGSGFPGGIRCT